MQERERFSDNQTKNSSTYTQNQTKTNLLLGYNLAIMAEPTGLTDLEGQEIDSNWDEVSTKSIRVKTNANLGC